ncbi:hypothetical protein BDA99DRAFT_449497, partial [Phascolomyces articulosus]
MTEVRQTSNSRNIRTPRTNKGKGLARSSLTEDNKEQKPKPKRRTRTTPRIEYDIVEDVGSKMAQITIGDLIKICPKLRRELHGLTAIRNNRSLNILDHTPKVDYTACYFTCLLQKHPILTLCDSGAASSCVSRTLAEELGLEISASSNTTFTLGNGSLQASHGII